MRKGMLMKTTAFLALLLSGALVAAQTYPPDSGGGGGGTYDGGAVTNPFLAPDGLVSAPAYAFTNDPDGGLYRIGANSVGMAAGGDHTATFANTQVIIESELGGAFGRTTWGWSSPDIITVVNNGGGTSTSWAYGPFGLSVSGAASNKFMWGFTYVDATQTVLNIGEDGELVFEGATDDGNETTLTVEDPTADRIATLPNITGVVEVEPSSSGALTDAANKTLLNCDCSWNWPSPVDRVAGTVEVTAYATDGTDYQLTTLTLEYVVQCDSGTTAAVTTALVPSTHTTATSAGTLTCTAFDSNSGGNITVGVNCDTSLTATTFTGKWQHNVRDRTCVDNGGGSYQ